MQKNLRRKSIKVEIFGIVFLSIFLISLVLGYLSFSFSKSRLVSMLGDSIRGIAVTTANFVSGQDLILIKQNIDLIREKHAAATSPAFSHVYEKMEDPQKIQAYALNLALVSYNKYLDILANVQKMNKIESPISIFIKDKNRLRLLLSSDRRFLYDAQYTIRPEAENAIASSNAKSTGIYKDKDGIWISAYAPIQMPAGSNIEAVIEINNKIDVYIKKLWRELITIILVCLIGIIGTSFLSYQLVDRLAVTVKRLNDLASELENEHYDIKIDIESEDEIGHLAQTFEKLRISIRRKIEELRLSLFKEKKAHLESIIALTNAMEVRDHYTRQHLYRVDKYALLIAKAIHLSRKEKEKLRYSCYLHDIGKIYIDDATLKKLRLTETEVKEIKKHSEKGAEIIEGIPFLRDVKGIILSHQEHYDGTGYPRGLKGEEIPLLARIVMVADAFDAMTTDRPYRAKMGFKEALDNIEKGAGTQFDPKVAKAFLKYRNRIEKIAKKHFPS